MKSKLRSSLSIKSWSWKKRLVVSLTLLAVVLGLFILHQANSPAVGTVAVSRQDQPVITDSTNYSTSSTEYFTLLYPSDLTPDYATEQPSDALTYVYYSKKDASQVVTNSLEAYIKPLPDGGITLDSNYKKYQSQPELYKLSQKFLRSETVDIASRDKGTPERVAMWVHGKYLLIIKMTGQNKNDLDTQFQTVIKSVAWLKS